MSYIKRQLDGQVPKPKRRRVTKIKGTDPGRGGNLSEKADAEKRLKISYEEYLKSKHWCRTRQQMLRAYGHKCAKCGSWVCIKIHHLSYKRLGQEKFEDLLPLCSKCHRRHHRDKKDNATLKRYVRKGEIVRTAVIEEMRKSRILLNYVRRPDLRRKPLPDGFLEEAEKIMAFFEVRKGEFYNLNHAMVAMGYRFREDKNEKKNSMKHFQRRLDRRNERTSPERKKIKEEVSKKWEERRKQIDDSFRNRVLPGA